MKRSRFPDASLVKDIDYNRGFDMPEDIRFTKVRIAVVLAFVATIILFVYGIKVWDWYLNELSAV